MPRLKLVFWFDKLKILGGILIFLIIVLTSHLTYIAIWLDIFLTATTSINNINFGSKNGVNFRFLAPLFLILAAITLIFLVFFCKFYWWLYQIRAKKWPAWLFYGSKTKIFRFQKNFLAKSLPRQYILINCFCNSID